MVLFSKRKQLLKVETRMDNRVGLGIKKPSLSKHMADAHY